MKLFNLEEAKAGKPVQTRDGKPVRILTFDRKGEEFQSIIALVDYGTHEQLFSYYENGCLAYGVISDGNLVMKSEKKEGWINVYAPCQTSNAYTDSIIYKTEEKARACSCSIRIATVKVEWEE